jgi:hypothetical protein
MHARKPIPHHATGQALVDSLQVRLASLSMTLQREAGTTEAMQGLARRSAHCDASWDLSFTL